MDPNPGASPRLLLVDGHSLAHRAYFAMFASQRRFATSDGRPTGAVYGFLNMLLRVLDDAQPTHVAVVFDAPGPTFRHERYEEYKAQRPGMATDLQPQIETIKDLLEAMRVARYELPGFEADDLLGTIACRAAAADQQVLILTGDRDALQLVSDNVKCILTVKGVSETADFDPAAVRETYGIEPAQMRDLKALMGDTSDNVPGIKGIGEKTALKLIREFGTLEGIYADLAAVSGTKLRELLAENREQAFLSRELVTINCEAPIEFSLTELARREPDAATLHSFLLGLEFKSFAKRLFPDGVGDASDQQATAEPGAVSPSEDHLASEAIGRTLPAAHAAEPTHVADHTVLETTTAPAIAAAAEWLRGCDIVAIELLTDGGRASRATIRGFGLAGAVGEGAERVVRAYGIPVLAAPVDLFAATAGQAAGGIEQPAVLALLAPLFAAKVPKAMHNAKPLLVALGHHGVAGCGVDAAGWVNLPGLVMDASVAAYLIDPARSRYELEKLALEYLRLEVPPATAEPLPETLGRRALAALQLVGPLGAELKVRELTPLWEQVERPLVTTLAHMEVTGVKLDLPALNQLDAEFSSRLEQLTQAIYGHAGGEFNINSTRQLAEILYDRLGLPSLKLTRKGKVASTDSEALESLVDQHEIVPLIIEHRSIQKLKSTYVDGLRALVDPSDGRIRTVLHQTVASTGRLSSAEPNLQNIPIREELGRRIRRAFVASGPAYHLLAADYSQIELRVLAHLSEDPVLIEAFALDQDIHRRTAADVFGVDLDAVSPSMRQAAKAVNFGIIYGISDFGLARNLGVGRAEAGEYIAQYFARYPRVNEFFMETIARARRDGFVTTILGRRRYLPDLFDNNFNIRSFGERTARNTPIQGSAADIIKLAMVRLDEEIRSRCLRSRMVLQVHDELLFDVANDERAQVRELVLQEMQGAYPLRVPLKVDAKTGANWYEAK